jgi:hypothetical protein
MGEFIRVEKHYCDCVGCELEHWVLKTADGKIIRVCPCCGKNTFLER